MSVNMHNVVVIGCGAIGLTTALAIQQKLQNAVRVTIVTEKRSPNTTSDVAAGMWLPYLIGNTPEDKIAHWAKLTKDYILDLWKKGEAKEAGISLQLIVAAGKFESNPSWLSAALGYTELTPKQLKYFFNSSDGLKGFAIVSFMWEGTKFLPYLQNIFLANGGIIEDKKVNNLNELKNYDVIVNCSGLASRDLVHDPEVVPIRGQIIRVRAPWQNFALILEDDESTYILPNHDWVILGGTHQYGDFDLKPNADDKSKILERCGKIVPGLIYAPIIEDNVGLRPGRNVVRLEMEKVEMANGKSLCVVHNYGHGGSGITLSIGCAKDAANIVSEICRAKNKSKL